MCRFEVKVGKVAAEQHGLSCLLNSQLVADQQAMH
jgi:hypothetical protein